MAARPRPVIEGRVPHHNTPDFVRIGSGPFDSPESGFRTGQGSVRGFCFYEPVEFVMSKVKEGQRLDEGRVRSCSRIWRAVGGKVRLLPSRDDPRVVYKRSCCS